MKNILKFKLAILASLSSACSIMPNNDFFVPASQDADSAWVRIIDNTEQTSIYQTLNGKRTGGLIRSSEWVLQNTQDRGMPKVSGEKYDIDYYETPLVAGVETAIVNVYVESKYSCLITTRFIPEKGKNYQFQLEADTLNYQCRAHASEIVKDSNGQWKLVPLQNVRYSAKEGNGWHPMHSGIGS
ncbi:MULTISPECIES: hypothetical protein [Pectobacterium]|uniref:hypothetical protein n=1 Tax=Pectobacterium TaxID=122277 RepID=UPI001CD3FA24|nr:MULTISPECIES: hypothetical protein [Pectobacterium]UUE46833.1 hypothetical protein L0Y28_09540 [Pectobacterium aroidearum]UUE51030.1 hypothetical protein L0Y23_09425 [Pectobacterium aroidearum]UUE55258.1 hypothetical protein L0Y30_09550 [Pectobacterium aroidearum]UUE55903.1 hypothetical protein L0Y27_11595 [Pectobacterium aroidearum]UUE63667.1 hypothetical protein L0Y29_09540 [Pectobacterium aroidearum]